MTKKATLAGMALVALGAAILLLGPVTYTTEETILDVGPVRATAEAEETVGLPPAVGWAGIGAGAALFTLGLVVGTKEP